MSARAHPDAAGRQRLFAFLSRLWVKELDDQAAALVAGPVGQQLLPAFHRSDEVGALASPEARRALFDTDFAHLTMVSLAPYESFFLRPDSMIEAGGQNPLATFMTKYGFEADLAAARAVSADHLGIELELMATLCGDEARALAQDNLPRVASTRAVEFEMLEQHLLAWAPVYLIAAQRTAKTALYREGAEATLHFLLADHEALR